MADEEDPTENTEADLEELLGGWALPRFGVPSSALIFAVSVGMTDEGDPVFAEDPDGGDELLRLLADSIPQPARVLEHIPDRPPHTQAMDWGLLLGSVAAIWQLAGLPGAIDIGKRLRSWLRARGRSGDAGAILFAALSHLAEAYPGATPDPSRVQYYSPVLPKGYPLGHQVVYIYRLYDTNGRDVYLLEFDSFGRCVTCVRRDIELFEVAGNDQSK